MVSVNSTMMTLGSEMPAFELPDPTGQVYTSSSFSGTPLLVMFICNHCPYVKHIRSRLAEVTKVLAGKGLAVVGINSNDAELHPDDSPEAMKSEAEEFGYTFAYLVDEDQSAAKAFRAACTPDLFLFDGNGKLAYRGQFDDSRPKNDLPVTGSDLVAAA
ncbi:thioredoxin family protein [soil metagenome]